MHWSRSLLALQQSAFALHFAITSQDAGAPLHNSCSGKFRGTAAGRFQVWTTEQPCASSVDTLASFESEATPKHILAVTYPALDASVFSAAPSHAQWASQVAASVQQESQAQSHSESQHVLQAQTGRLQLLGQHEELLLYGIDEQLLQAVDTLFPPLAQLTLLSEQSQTEQSDDSRLQSFLPLQYSPAVDRALSALTVHQLQSDLHWLSGEDSKSPIYSRHSVSQGARDAASYIQDQISLAGGNCSLVRFQQGFAPNVVCHFPSAAGSSNETVLVSAHYDSRGTFGSVDAPGADDDGSGTSVLLSIAKAIAAQDIQFRRPVMLVAFAGEEQGLVGSRALAQTLRQSNKDIFFALQMDMLAYRAKSEPLSMGMPDKIGSTVARQIVWDAATMYVPQLRTGLTPACCSDHQSFHEAGYAATWVFERPGPIADPQYHQSGDTSDREGYDWEQMRAIGQVVLASLLHVAGAELGA